MLSDTCSDFNSFLEEDDADIPAIVQDFLEGVDHYSEPFFKYPSGVIDRLKQLANAWVKCPCQRHLEMLSAGAEATRKAYDETGFSGVPFPDLEKELENILTRGTPVEP
jgi:hypothetical protein